MRHLHTELTDVTLRAEEKAAMRTRLVAFMREHPLPIPSDDWYGIRSPLHLPALQTVRVILSTMVIAAMIGGSVAAAEGSLPGDVLYPVKVNVNETVRSAVTVSSSAQAVWDVRRAARRLEEAEKLAISGRLDADTTAKLEAQFEEHAEKSIALAEESGDPTVKAAVHSEIEATLEAHGAVIRDLMDADEAIEESFETFAAVVAEKAEISEDARMAAEDELGSATTTTEARALKAEKWELREKMDEVERRLDRLEDEIDPAFEERVNDIFDDAEHAFNKGKELLKSQEFSEARITFNKAQRIALEVEILTSIGSVLAEAKEEAMEEEREAQEAATATTTDEEATTTTPPATATPDGDVMGTSTDGTATTTDVASTSSPLHTLMELGR